MSLQGLNFLRSSPHLRVVSFIGAVCFLSALTLVSVRAQTLGDSTPVLKTSEILRGHMLSGPGYGVDATVRNDGLMNIFRVTVDRKTYTVMSNVIMRQRLQELVALQRMEALARSDVYKNAVKNAALSPLRTAKNLVTEPVDTIKGIASGVGTLFSGIGHSLFGGASRQESGVLKTTLGFAAAKRKFAYRFGIDPYTSFPPVRERLNEISWAGVAGGLTVGGAFRAIPGAGGAVVSTTKATDTLNRMVRDNTPAELKSINAGKLSSMGVHSSLAEIFLEHPDFSPTEKTKLVSALASISASGRGEFIQRASLAHNETMAVFMRRWAEMMAAYHHRVKPIARIVRVGKAPFAQRADGVLVGLFPIDYLAWTQKVAQRHATNMKSIGSVSGVTGGEVWLEGGMSPKARQALEAQKWVVKENVGRALGL